MSITRRVLAQLLLASSVLAAAGAATAQELTFRLSTEVAQTQHAEGDILLQLSEELKERFGDTANVEVFHAVLGNEQVHIDQVRTGQIDVYSLGSEVMTMDTKWSVFELPFLFSSFDGVRAFFDSELGTELKQSLRETTGLEVIGIGSIGFRNFTSNTVPITTPADLAGMKMRVPGSQSRLKLFQMLGASPLSIPYNELYIALSNGTADGQEQSLSTLNNGSFYEVQKYLSLSSYLYTPYLIVMNGRKFDSLTDAQKAMVLEAGAAAGATQMASVQADDSRLLEHFATVAPHLTVNTVDTASFREAVQPFWTEMMPQIGEEFAAKVVEFAAPPGQ